MSAVLFGQTYCSQCGGEFGPGTSGFSSCNQHRSALVTREQHDASELYRASLETDVSVIRIYVSDESEYWLSLSGTQRSRLALMTRSECAALRDMLTEALEAKQGAPA